jgi:hypothetical protein
MPGIAHLDWAIVEREEPVQMAASTPVRGNGVCWAMRLRLAILSIYLGSVRLLLRLWESGPRREISVPTLQVFWEGPVGSDRTLWSGHLEHRP